MKPFVLSVLFVLYVLAPPGAAQSLTPVRFPDFTPLEKPVAEQIGDRLAGAIASQGPTDAPYRVSATVGTSTLDPMLSLRDAIERADAELYTRKKRRSGPTALANIDVVGERE